MATVVGAAAYVVGTPRVAVVVTPRVAPPIRNDILTKPNASLQN